MHNSSCSGVNLCSFVVVMHFSVCHVCHLLCAVCVLNCWYGQHFTYALLYSESCFSPLVWCQCSAVVWLSVNAGVNAPKPLLTFSSDFHLPVGEMKMVSVDLLFYCNYMISPAVCRCRLNAKMYLRQGKKSAVSVCFAFSYLGYWTSVFGHNIVLSNAVCGYVTTLCRHVAPSAL